jgi:hypothetical protein
MQTKLRQIKNNKNQLLADYFQLGAILVLSIVKWYEA